VSSASSELDEPIPNGCSLADLSPGGKISLVSISLEGFLLGNLTSLALCLTFYCLFVLTPLPFWRPPLFISILTFFHFCEFYTYARWNTKNTTAESYLTLSNGKPYIAAMTFAFVETLVTTIFFQSWQQKWSHPLVQILGIALLVVGQFARHSAIATAGTSFNHQVQRTRKDDHVLVTSGIYRYLRHPSYFGFYWWAIGTQLLLGNLLSTSLFAMVLWRFFFRRIPSKRFISYHRQLADRSR
jgi:protein-S-isoprenylcysteine O-methyltransferase